MRSRVSTSNGRIIITGTGRTGTTFLVQLFSELGFDTGYRPEEAIASVDPISQAGLEKPLVHEDNPYVIKSPFFSDNLQEALRSEQIRIYMAIIPVRDLFEAAESRRRVSAKAAIAGFNALAHPGGLWHTSNPANQQEKLARQFYMSVFPLIEFDVPILFLHFPRLVLDKWYLYHHLCPLLDDHGVGETEFLNAYSKVVRPDAVHKFDKRPSADWYEFAGLYKLRVLLARLRRRGRKLWNRSGLDH